MTEVAAVISGAMAALKEHDADAKANSLLWLRGELARVQVQL